jgi:ketosteroid isomerase-like protein
MMATDTSLALTNAAIMRRAVDAFGSGDMATLTELFAPELKWHIPGRSVIAGDYNGRDAVFGLFGKLMELTNGTFRVEAREIIGDEKGGVFVMNDTGERNGKRLDVMITIRVHLESGKFVEMWEHVADLYAYDEFWPLKQQDPGSE